MADRNEASRVNVDGARFDEGSSSADLQPGEVLNRGNLNITRSTQRGHGDHGEERAPASLAPSRAGTNGDAEIAEKNSTGLKFELARDTIALRFLGVLS